MTICRGSINVFNIHLAVSSDLPPTMFDMVTPMQINTAEEETTSEKMTHRQSLSRAIMSLGEVLKHGLLFSLSAEWGLECFWEDEQVCLW